MKWVKRWGYEMEAKPVRKGIYRLKTGGFFLRARVGDSTGNLAPIYEVAHELTTVAEAQRRRDALIEEARASAKGVTHSKQLWGDFAVSLLEERVARGDIESAATVEWWQDSLEHYLVPAFGRRLATEVKRVHIDTWFTKTVLPWMRDGRVIQRMRKGKPFGKPRLVKLSAPFVNGLLRIVRNISNAIKVKFDLAKSAFEGIEFLNEGRTYTREEPNALPIDTDIVERFVAIARQKFPQHYFMIVLGMATGLRPSSMRALRRKGPQADLNWETGELQIRRSHSRGQSIMNQTKTKVDNTFTLPASMLEEARRHVEQLPDGPAQESDLLFPTRQGKLRSRGVLVKPFKAIIKELGLPMRITPRAMRRTFNDLMRASGIDNVVTRSISGHQTDEMRVHYSTAQAREQAQSIERAHAAVTGREKNQR